MSHPAPNPSTAPTPRTRDRLLTLQRDVRASDWSQTNARSGLVCLPVIAAWVFFGVITGKHEWAVLSVSGAVAVGFGAFQNFARRHFVPMLVTLVGIAVATFVGTLAGHLGWRWLVVLAAISAYGYGAMTMLGHGAWWIGLQWMIALVVYGAHPAGPLGAAVNAVAVFAGGATQLAFLTALLPTVDRLFRRQPQPPLNEEGPILSLLLRNLNPFTESGRYATRVAIAVVAAALVNHTWNQPNGYWTPMTTIILLKPDPYETTVRVLRRLLGTVAGAGLTTLAVALLRPDNATLGLLLLAAIWGCYTLQRVNYALFATCITIYVVLLLSALGLPEPEVAGRRMIYTCLGALIALAAHRIPVIGGPRDNGGGATASPAAAPEIAARISNVAEGPAATPASAPAPAPEVDERDILPAARKYKRPAVEALLALHYPRVQRMARGLTGREDVARGVVRWVMRQSLKVLPTFTRDGAPERWFNHHTLLTTRRSAQHAPTVASDLLILNGPKDSPAHAAFVRAVRSLDTQQREAFILHHAEQMQLRSMAVAMDCSTEAAQNHLNAAESHVKAIAAADFDARILQMRQAYQALSPTDPTLLPTVRSYARGFLWPRRIKRILKASVVVLVLAGLYLAWRHDLLNWIPGL